MSKTIDLEKKGPSPKPETLSLRALDVQALAAIVPKRDPRRVLKGIFIEKKFSMATDGRSGLVCRHEEGDYNGPEFIADTYELRKATIKTSNRQAVQVRHDPKEKPGAGWSIREEEYHLTPGVTTISSLTDGNTSKTRATDGKYPAIRSVIPLDGIEDTTSGWIPKFEFALNASRIAKLLKVLVPLAKRDDWNHESILFQIRDSSSPIRLISGSEADEKKWVGLVMPVRITERLKDEENRTEKDKAKHINPESNHINPDEILELKKIKAAAMDLMNTDNNDAVALLAAQLELASTLGVIPPLAPPE